MRNLSPVLPIVQHIARSFQPEKIILFGSYAYGQPTPDSDYDLLVVMDTEDDPLWVAARIAAAVSHPVPLDIVVKQPSALARSLTDGDLFETEVMTKGILLYEASNN
jgi:predicted nucleotidyltransferase